MGVPYSSAYRTGSVAGLLGLAVVMWFASGIEVSNG